MGSKENKKNLSKLKKKGYIKKKKVNNTKKKLPPFIQLLRVKYVASLMYFFRPQNHSFVHHLQSTPIFKDLPFCVRLRKEI